MHLYPATSSIHVPWFRQGLDAHSLMLVWQLGPAEGNSREQLCPSPGAAAGSHRGSPLSPGRKGPALRHGPRADPASLHHRQQALPRAGGPRAPRAGAGSGSAAGASGPLTTEAFPAGAHVAAGHVLAGAAVDTGVGFTLVIVDVTACPTPPGLTVTLVPAEVTTPQLRRGPRRGGPDRGHSRLCHSSCGLTGGRRRSTDPQSFKAGRQHPPARRSGKGVPTTDPGQPLEGSPPPAGCVALDGVQNDGVGSLPTSEAHPGTAVQGTQQVSETKGKLSLLYTPKLLTPNGVGGRFPHSDQSSSSRGTSWVTTAQL